MLLKELVLEGTWATPNTLKDAQELAKLLQNPLPAGTATAMIYDLIGDDGLFDDIDAAQDRNPNEDVRPLIFDTLRKWLPQAKADLEVLGTSAMQWRDPWDPEAIKLLRRLTRMRI